jgi:hypothetical protein
MTIRAVVARLRADINEVRGDSPFTDRHLWNAFWTSSRLILQREADSNVFRDSKAFRTINANTETVNMFEGTCVPLECAVCRVKIPKPLIGKKRGFIYNFIGSPDYHTSFSVVTPFEFSVKTKIKGTKTNYAYIDGDYLYLSKCLPCLKIIALFEEFGDSGGGGCSVLDNDVNMPDYLIENSIRMAKENFTKGPVDHAANKSANN